MQNHPKGPEVPLQMEPDAVTHSFEVMHADLVVEVVDTALDPGIMPAVLRVEVMSAARRVRQNPGSPVEVVSEMEEDAVTHNFEAVYGALGVEAKPVALGIEAMPVALGVEVMPAALDVEAIPAPLVVEGKKTVALHVHRKPESLAKKHHR